MVWPFGPKTFLDPEVEAWHLDTWTWLLDNLGGLDALNAAPLVLSNADFFPASDKTGEDRAAVLFERVKDLAGLGDWPCTVMMQPNYPGQPAGQFMVVKPGTTEPVGEHAAPGEWEALITYDSHLLDDPLGLVATFANELAHYRLSYITAEPPGGYDLSELVTELTVAFTGFGLFGAATSSRFRNRTWSSQGYLSPRDWAFALAVFQLLRGQSAEALSPHLDVRIYDDVVEAERYLEKHPERWAMS